MTSRRPAASRRRSAADPAIRRDRFEHRQARLATKVREKDEAIVRSFEI
jgi:hypothetical protein